MTLTLWIVGVVAIYIVGIPTIGRSLARTGLQLWQEAHAEVKARAACGRHEGLNFNSGMGLGGMFYFPSATLFGDLGLDALPRPFVRVSLGEGEFASVREYKIIVALMWPFKSLYMLLTGCMLFLILFLWVLGAGFIWVLENVVRRPFIYIFREISE